MSRRPPPTPKEPSPELVLFIARAAKELGQKAMSRSIKPEYVAKDRFEMLVWAWRLRRALDPYWGRVPFWKDPDFGLVGWSSQIQLRLSHVHNTYERAHKYFAAYCDDYPDHPLITTCFRSVKPSNRAAVANRPMTRPTNASDQDWLEADKTYFARDHVPNWNASQEDLTKALHGKIADQICSAFEKKKTREELIRDGISLELQAFPELMPHLYQAVESCRDDEETDRTQLNRDDLACAAWLALKKEGKVPTIAEVARRIKCHRTILYRLPNFMGLIDAEEMESADRKSRLPKGQRDKVTGRVEAWVNDNDVED